MSVHHRINRILAILALAVMAGVAFAMAPSGDALAAGPSQLHDSDCARQLAECNEKRAEDEAEEVRKIAAESMARAMGASDEQIILGPHVNALGRRALEWWRGDFPSDFITRKGGGGGGTMCRASIGGGPGLCGLGTFQNH